METCGREVTVSMVGIASRTQRRRPAHRHRSRPRHTDVAARVELPGAQEPFQWTHYVHDRMQDHKAIDSVQHCTDRNENA